jgi:glycosyltransferase involved in cell wall biosynthesis
MHRNKAFDTLLAALSEVPDAYLWLAGEGALKGDIEILARRLGVLGRVRFLGWRDDAAALMRTADIVVCPSRQEPLGNVVLEAWAQRRPIVAAASEGPSALIEQGHTGLLVPIDQPAAMATAIRSLIADPARAASLAEAGHARFEAAFSEAAVVRRYLALFEQLTGSCAA